MDHCWQSDNFIDDRFSGRYDASKKKLSEIGFDDLIRTKKELDTI